LGILTSNDPIFFRIFEQPLFEVDMESEISIAAEKLPLPRRDV
jgi:hypothetical protein